LQGAEEQTVAAIAKADLDCAKLADDERALLQFVGKITQHAYRTTADDIARLRKLGWTDSQISEAVYVTGLFALFNRVSDAFGLMDPGYSAMSQAEAAKIRPAEQFE